MQKYQKPPIVEAVIDFGFADKLSDRDMRRVQERLKQSHPAAEEEMMVGVEVGLAGVKATPTKLAGLKLSAANGVDICLVRERHFATVRLAPYEGWEGFEKSARENFEEFTAVVGRRAPRRIGVRFINRIDYPIAMIQGQDLAGLLTVGVALPDGVAKGVNNYAVNVEFVEALSGVKVKLNVASQRPALIDHESVLLDIDAILDTGVAERADAWWAQVTQLRQVKNRVFEMTITGKTRELFE